MSRCWSSGTRHLFSCPGRTSEVPFPNCTGRGGHRHNTATRSGGPFYRFFHIPLLGMPHRHWRSCHLPKMPWPGGGWWNWWWPFWWPFCGIWWWLVDDDGGIIMIFDNHFMMFMSGQCHGIQGIHKAAKAGSPPQSGLWRPPQRPHICSWQRPRAMRHAPICVLSTKIIKHLNEFLSQLLVISGDLWWLGEKLEFLQLLRVAQDSSPPLGCFNAKNGGQSEHDSNYHTTKGNASILETSKILPQTTTSFNINQH